MTASAVRGHDGHFRFSIGVVQDISGRKDAEERLTLQYAVTRILTVKRGNSKSTVQRVLVVFLRGAASARWALSGGSSRASNASTAWTRGNPCSTPRLLSCDGPGRFGRAARHCRAACSRRESPPGTKRRTRFQFNTAARSSVSWSSSATRPSPLRGAC